MKKLSSILVTLGVTIFLLSFGMKSEAVGQCPSGASTTMVDFVINGCTWRATICYECPVALGPTWFGVTKLNLISGGPCDDYPTAKDSVEKRLVENFVYIVGLCTNEIPPCSLSTKTIYARKYICWRYFNNMGDISLEACGHSAFCVQEYELCWGEFGPVASTENPPPYVVGEPDCLEGEIPSIMPDPGYFSNCFPLNFPCE